MSNATIQSDEDLIILSDSTSSDTSLIDFNFDSVKTEAISNDINIESTVSFNFDLETEPQTKEEPKIDFLLEDTSSMVTATDMDDLFSLETPKTEISETVDFAVVNETPVIVEEPIFALETPKIEKQEVKTSFSRNDILEEAIAKMQSRKEVILTTKTLKQSKVDEINEQIKKLKKEVSEFEGEIKDLEKEDSTIDLDIASFEKMKSVIVDVSDRTRVHNLDNIKKK